MEPKVRLQKPTKKIIFSLFNSVHTTTPYIISKLILKLLPHSLLDMGVTNALAHEIFQRIFCMDVSFLLCVTCNVHLVLLYLI